MGITHEDVSHRSDTPFRLFPNVHPSRSRRKLSLHWQTCSRRSLQAMLAVSMTIRSWENRQWSEAPAIGTLNTRLGTGRDVRTDSPVRYPHTKTYRKVVKGLQDPLHTLRLCLSISFCHGRKRQPGSSSRVSTFVPGAVMTLLSVSSEWFM